MKFQIRVRIHTETERGLKYTYTMVRYALELGSKIGVLNGEQEKSFRIFLTILKGLIEKTANYQIPHYDEFSTVTGVVKSCLPRIERINLAQIWTVC